MADVMYPVCGLCGPPTRVLLGEAEVAVGAGFGVGAGVKVGAGVLEPKPQAPTLIATAGETSIAVRSR